MSVTYKCDNCGATYTNTDGIVGNEYKYDRAGFATLASWARAPGVIDVCARCHKAVQDTFDAHRKAKIELLDSAISIALHQAKETGGPHPVDARVICNSYRSRIFLGRCINCGYPKNTHSI